MEAMHILIVDDEEELVSTLVERLELRNHRAEGATTGEEAVRRVRDKRYDVVVLDVKMPGTGGLQVLRQIKDIRPDVPVILLTGHGSEVDAQEGMCGGAFDYLAKPIDLEDLMHKMEDAIRGQGARPDDG